MTIDFCLPVKNEESILKSNLVKLLEFLLLKKYSFDWKIIVILNDCNDRSEEILDKLSLVYPEQIKYLSVLPPGKGGALKHYFSISSADILVFMDIDLAVSLEDLDNLINPVIQDQSDLVIGSRLLKNSRVDRSFFRSYSSVIYNLLSRNILNHKFFDLQCGFKAFKSEVFVKVSPSLKDNNWFFDTELVVLANFYNFRINEIPVNWAENRYAQRVSKVSLFKHTWSFIKNLISLRHKVSRLLRDQKISR